MNNLFTLVKIELQKFLSSFNTKGKKIRKTPILYVGLLILGLALLMSFTYSFLIIFTFKAAEVDPSAAVILFAGLSSLLVFMSAMSQARGIYIGDDYDLLTTLPLRKRDIVASKILTMYAVELSFSLVVMIPHGIVHIILMGNVYLFLISLLLGFLAPIVPIAIAILISLLVTLATSRFKAANMVSTILYALVIVGISGLSMLTSYTSNKEQAASIFSGVGNVIKWINPSFYLLELSFADNNLFLILFVAVNLLVAILSVLFIALFFDKLHEIVSSTSMKKEYVRKDLKNKSEGKILLSLEYKRLVNSKMYFVNTIMGSIMAVLGSAVYMFSMKSGFANASDSESATEIFNAIFIPIFIVVLCFILGISSPTASSINIEGKTFWLTKSLPTDYQKLLKAKLLFSWSLTVPAVLIISTIAVIVHHQDVWGIIFSYVIPILFIILYSLIALIIALHHPKLKWNSEAEAIKNSSSVVISMFIGFGLTGVIAPVLIVFPLVLKDYAYLGYIITTVSLLIPSIPCYLYLKKYFGKRIELIEDL